MEIDKKLYSDIKDYCKLNGLKIGEYINGLLKDAFIKDKFGSSPFESIIREKNAKASIKNEESLKTVETVKDKAEITENTVNTVEIHKNRKRRLN